MQATNLPLHAGGIVWVLLPTAQHVNLPACFPHCPFNAEHQAVNSNSQVINLTRLGIKQKSTVNLMCYGHMICNRCSGVSRNLKKKGGGAQFIAKPAGPNIVKSKKKGRHALRLSFIRISPLLCAFVCMGGGGATPSLGSLLRCLKVLESYHRIVMPSSTALLQNCRGRFDLRLEPIAFDLCTGRLLTQRTNLLDGCYHGCLYNSRLSTGDFWYAARIKSHLHHARDIMLKRVTSDGIHLRGLAPGQHNSEEMSPR